MRWSASGIAGRHTLYLLNATFRFDARVFGCSGAFSNGILTFGVGWGGPAGRHRDLPLPQSPRRCERVADRSRWALLVTRDSSLITPDSRLGYDAPRYSGASDAVWLPPASRTNWSNMSTTTSRVVAGADRAPGAERRPLGVSSQPVERGAECRLRLLIPLLPLPEPYGVQMRVADHVQRPVSHNFSSSVRIRHRSL